MAPSTRAVLALSTLVAAVATVGSLFFSLGLGLVPCELCWYQRILMYPLVVVLGVAAAEERADVYRTVLPLSTLGILVSSYHVYIQLFPVSTGCTLGGGCSSIQYPMLGGLLTIPRLALIAFVLITVLVGVVARGRNGAWAGR
ncbi:disulfide bond formation protein dsbb [Halogeometricum pallidum JCM 14848]|uniref:Disulfide bond formation protein dsbb n=1 Tax=Halogeometricum pallidum JCM 14848 TaxID=1227487 RepID=M0DLC6_HALPD|nr:disulfide bond formation protein B [Halogeometricum pallidum]ELZ34954.1 disulfide bond formation protein dsbb [Halogeometricum pallidum JCM 14848]